MPKVLTSEISNDAIHWHGVETVRKAIEADLARALNTWIAERLDAQIMGEAHHNPPKGLMNDSG